MLIYNHKKKFLGIDKSDLKTLGFSDLRELYLEAADFADLFAKSVGYIHNFKHVHWIDYALGDDSITKPKVIITAKDINYTASIEIKIIYLADNPSQQAYIVNLLNLRVLTDAQSEQITIEQTQRSFPHMPTQPESENFEKITYDPYDSPQEIPQNMNSVIDLDSDTPTDIDIVEPEGGFVKADEPAEESKQSYLEDEINNNEFDNYIFNPETASEALGLPVDLIEEFIQDFTAQANIFKPQLYTAAQKRDMDSLKILSHKLKGVAANLRIEDALHVLTSIGFANAHDNLEGILNKLYKIIDKLSGKAHQEESQPPESNKKEEIKDTDDDIILSIKEESHPTADIIKMDDDVIQMDDDIIQMDDDAIESENEVINVESNLSPDIIEAPKFDDYEISIIDTPIEVNSHDSNKAVSYDRESVANNIGLDMDSFNKLFKEYTNIGYELCKKIARSADSGDLSSCKSDAIQLKGMSNNMRIHKFDDRLDAIINSSSSDGIRKIITTVAFSLKKISDAEGK